MEEEITCFRCAGFVTVEWRADEGHVVFLYHCLICGSLFDDVVVKNYNESIAKVKLDAMVT
jgi:hypothetical protein